VAYKKICDEADALKLKDGLKGHRRVFESLYMAVQSVLSADEMRETAKNQQGLKNKDIIFLPDIKCLI
jgi:hypothetical protein